MKGAETQVSMIDWRSWKLRRPARGSNGSEAQGIAEAEDKGWRSRLMFAILSGNTLQHGNAEALASIFTSFLIMDSRGCYDLVVSNESLAMSMSDSKAAIDLPHVQHGVRDGSNSFTSYVGTISFKSSKFFDKGINGRLQRNEAIPHEQVLDFEV